MKITCKSVCLFYVLFWWASVIIILRPHTFSVSRAVAEYNYWGQLSYWSWFRVLTGEWVYEDYHGLVDIVGPMESYPRNDPALHYITYTRENFTLEAAYEATKMDIPFIVKGFATDYLGKFEYDYILDTFNDDEYGFEVGAVEDSVAENRTQRLKFERVKKNLKDGLREMRETENLYLRFAQTLAPNNPEFDEALIKSIERIGPLFPELVGHLPNANRLCFIGMGEKSKTTQHNAITDNWFLQVAGAKRWVITSPEYTPYMKAIFTNTIALGSLLPLYKEKMGIPVLEIVSEPGDLFFFPAFWWHEVNNQGALNFGCGIRPRENIFRIFKSVIFPPATFPSGTLGVNLGLFPSALKIIAQNFPLRSILTGSADGFDAAKHQKWWGKDKKGGEGAEKEKEDL